MDHPSFTSLLEKLDSLNNRGTLVLVTGVFDLLHAEHRRFLQLAKEAGDFLLVGLECDSRVKSLKGQNRPIWDQDRRLAEIQALSVVDGAFILPEQFDNKEDRERLIRLLRPDVLAVSSHSPFQTAKRAIMEKYGGRLQVVYQQNPELSTTKIIDR